MTYSANTLWSNITTNPTWIIPETLTDEQVKATRHLLKLRELSPDELTEMADAIAEHCGVTPEIARSSLGVLKTLLQLGELQDKLDTR